MKNQRTKILMDVRRTADLLNLKEFVRMKQHVWGLTGTLGHTDRAILVLGIGVGLQFECVPVVNDSLRTQRHARA